jgi:competence protein ComGF
MPAILTQKYFYKQPRFWRWAISIALVLLMVFAYWKELSFLYMWLTGQHTLLFTDLSQVRNLVILFISLIAFFGLLFLSLLFVSQFVLPVSSGADRWKVFQRLWMYFTGFYGATVFIKEGKEIAKPEELRSSRPGMAFVDLSSAVVLEKQYSGGGSRTLIGAGLPSLFQSNSKKRSARGNSQQGAASSGFQSARAAGPGIAFTGFGERLRGTVSLRRQFRLKPEVKATLRDGFEVMAHVFVGFTLGEAPEELKVTLTGEGPESIQVIHTAQVTQDDRRKTIIRGFADELDADDKTEIFRFIQKVRKGEVSPESQSIPSEVFQFKAPYIFDGQRVFNAVYGNARMIKEGVMEEWVDLPLKVAVETFHDMLSVESYDNLYLPDKPDRFPFREEFLPRFSRRMRNQGVLAYRVIFNADRTPLQKDQPWNEAQLDIYPVQALRGSKVLRDRGIRILFSGCAELRPTNKLILQQRLDYWRARWEKNKDLTLAGFDYKEMQIRSHARAQAQQDMIYSLSKMLNSGDVSKEAIAIRVFQALESFASEPATEKLLPKETLNALWSLHEWLLPFGGNQGGTPPGSERAFPPEHPEKEYPVE